MSSRNARQVVLDVETTGFGHASGDRIAEIAVIEIVNGEVDENIYFHTYLDPEREFHPGAASVNGLSWEDLRGESKFAEISDDLLNFIENAEIIAHNAQFDISFLNSELSRIGHRPLRNRTTCTVKMARALHGNIGRCSLDDLLRYYRIHHIRDTHSAWEDAVLCGQIYLKMMQATRRG